MGKTHFIKSQLNPSLMKNYPDANLQIISNDEIRQACVKKWLASHK
jgi:hypothetical protein